MVFWAFLGIEGAAVIGARVKNPSRDVPIATLGGLGIAAVIYIAASAAIMGILPASVLAKSTAPFADAAAPVLGAIAAGVVALCAMVKASGTLSATILMTLETAESDAILGQLRPAAAAQSAARASSANLVFTGVLVSLIALASASPTLARQFTMVTNVSVVLAVMAYGAACLALVRLGSALPVRIGAWAMLLGLAGAGFSVWLISSSDPDLLIWSAGFVAAAVIAYLAIWTRRAWATRRPAEA
jgi:arginine:agmatine antiporter